ncbi:MAG: hypothetical protein MK193_13700 [Lentisphaeria bacterium]|nr:hypothetical protein [Lentisphaeria bacterium]
MRRKKHNSFKDHVEAGIILFAYALATLWGSIHYFDMPLLGFLLWVFGGTIYVKVYLNN